MGGLRAVLRKRGVMELPRFLGIERHCPQRRGCRFPFWFRPQGRMDPEDCASSYGSCRPFSDINAPNLFISQRLVVRGLRIGRSAGQVTQSLPSTALDAKDDSIAGPKISSTTG